jgi:peptidoglycan lytic transglycosylase
MYVPATPASPAAALASAAIVTSAAEPLAGLRPVTDPVTLVGDPAALVGGPAALVGGPAAPVRTALSIRRADLNVLDGRPATIAGRLTPALADRVISLQMRTHRGWKTLASTHTGARGRYRLRYTPHRLASELVRVRFAGDAQDRGSHRRAGRLNVYRLAGASWYGGGGSLACGGWLTSATVGVANKTLPCGTLVTLRYGGRTVRVPVIDRGPYVEGREFDLTEATKQALGFAGTGEVWATR